MSDGPGTVWLLSIEHRHGTNHSAHLTERGAQDAVYDHVCIWWDEEANRWSDEPQAQPDDPAEAVEAYFDLVEDEYYYIEEVPVGP
jgi:hypothetical protein